MHKGLDDSEKQRSRSNNLRNGENIINIGNSSLLPNLDFVNYNGDELIKTVIDPVSGINMTELLTYFDPNIVHRERNENYTFVYDKSYRYISQMRKCEKSDFESRGYFSNSKDENPFRNRLCPDIKEENAQDFILKNLYANHESRNNFAIEIYKCQNTTTHKCKSDEQITEFFDGLLVNQYFLQGGIDFHHFNDEYDTRPLSDPPIKYFDTQIA